MPTQTQAHQRYYQCFNQDALYAVESQIMLHIFTFTLDDPIQREMFLSEGRARNIMDAVRATAKQMSSIPDYDKENGSNRLMTITLIEEFPMLTVEAIASFLSHFQANGDTTARDYFNTIKALYSIHQIRDTMITSVQSASSLHGAQGQFVYELLTTAQHLLYTAQAILKDDPRYASEKLKIAQNHLKWSMTAAHRYRPDLFSAPDKDM